MTAIKIGDRIKFRTVCRWNNGWIATRTVNGWRYDEPTVAYGGWRDFVVHRREIIEVNGNPI